MRVGKDAAGRLPIVRLPGGPRQRGLAHGEQLRREVAAMLELWGDSLERGYGVDRRAYIDLFFQHTRYEATLARLAPQVLDEVLGIADGAGVDYRMVLALQHVNEEFEYGPRFAAIAPVEAGEACSTVVAPAREGRPPLLAQNLDLAQYLDGYQVLLQVDCDQSDGQVLALTVPGMISLMGMNSHGFAVCDNALTQLRTDPADGLPIFALYRQLLESRSLAEARGRVESTPHAVGLNWVMGDAAGVAMIERSGGTAAPFGPGEDGAPVWHTNHPLVCEDWAPAFLDDGQRPRPARSSYLRLAALHQRLAPGAEVTVETLKAALSSRDDPDYPVSRGGGRNLEDQQIGFTLASSVFEFAADGTRWHLAAGPPHANPYHLYEV
jgi:isopenicillin-N N-acyltransferase-like protein